jgi:hypothetical protein
MLKSGALAFAGLSWLGIIGAGCLTRPVSNSNPITKTIVGLTIQDRAVDKVDLLFMIDNSASMGDKQALLAQAVPDLIRRLVSPNCVNSANVPTGQTAQPDGTCPPGTSAEFPPVHDLHIGVVSSSLGSRGSDQCDPTLTNPANAALNAHNDDRGELLDRGGAADDPTVESAVGDASPYHFLSWFPSVTANAGKVPPPTTGLATAGAAGQNGTLIGDFTTLIEGVHEHGCGFESQNEAWYRFLIAPDPEDAISKNGVVAHATGIDATILQQRAEFLRPDSLVAIIVVTDENEEAVDPLSVHGQGWAFMSRNFPGSPADLSSTAPQGTIECSHIDPNRPTATGPNDPNCTSCALVQGQANFSARCPKDGANGHDGYLDPHDDDLNVRFYHQKERFGLFAGYPTSRYVRGLTRTTVPDIAHSHDAAGNYIGDEDSQAVCTNPLFAQNLPTDRTQELCNLAPGPRRPDLVFYAAIAGVPHQLLQAKPGIDRECDAATRPEDCPQKSVLSPSDWTLIMGRDPEHYDFRGADFHMVESIEPRTTNTAGWANASACPPGQPDDCDPINGREWTTNKGDLQFSCIFPLSQPKDCTQNKYSEACDCTSGAYDASSQLCQRTTQIYGKAYPPVREMIIAKAMSEQNAQAGGQGIVSSLCPIHVTEQSPGDPLYGYRPAMNAIINRLKDAIPAPCLPEKLEANSCGEVPCLILVSLTEEAVKGDPALCKNPGSVCGKYPGLAAPSDLVVASRFCDAQEQEWQANGGPQSAAPEPYTVPVCQMDQLVHPPARASTACPAAKGVFDSTGSCAASPVPGWCYATGAAAGRCTHTILFTQGEPPSHAVVNLQCIEQAVTVVNQGGGGGPGGP